MQFRDAEALYEQALTHCRAGRFAEGVEFARRALTLEPSRASLHILLGRALLELGEPQGALASLDRAVGCEPDSSDAHGVRGDVLAQLGLLPDAADSYRRAIDLDPDGVANWCSLGACQLQLGLCGEALESFERALAFAPDNVVALVCQGDALRALERPAQAIASYERALAVIPAELAALQGRAAALNMLGRPWDALASLDAALAIEPSDLGALSNRALLLRALHRLEEGLASLDGVLRVDPDHVDALLNRGLLLFDLGRYPEAVASYDRAVAIAPEHVGAHCNRAKALFALNRFRDALAAAERALALAPDHVESLYTRGNVLVRQRRYEDAVVVFERLLALAPQHPHALAQLVGCCLWLCDWAKAAIAAEALQKAISAGTAVVSPHILLQLSADPVTVLAATRRYLEREVSPPTTPALPNITIGVGTGKIRIAYLSGDFRVHPVAYLIAELLERHDRSRFEVIAISFGPDDNSDLRARIAHACDRFHDVRIRNDQDVAALVRQAAIDIAVDLGGHTDHARPGILQLRPAPVAVNYLGFPGTMGADFIDYIIADAVVLPFTQQPWYAEQIVHLPDSFMVQDATRPISPQTPTRKAANLPDEGVVFCCFNNSYKISADTFAAWLRLLAKVEDAVLWLTQPDARAAENLRAAAVAAGIDPARIVFAPRMPSMADHLARHRLADLFLDTPGYNAHSTAADALWAGLPVLTCAGSAFQGRVAASLLHAVGLPELVTERLADYEVMALTLAHDPAALSVLRQTLARNRTTQPLFDTDRFRRHLEQAYATMIEAARRGEPPRSFAVDRVGP